MTSATDELRRMLDERGIDYDAPHMGFTVVHTNDVTCKFYERLEEPEFGVFAVVTTEWLDPAQAIDATLGRGTCHRALDFDGTRYVCSACGEHFGPCRWHFCPNCGRRVIGGVDAN